jgi:ATP-dependent Clp protease ATP-binding subunit ClpC
MRFARFDMAEELTAIVCTACGGDPRRSATCKVCGGAGIGVPSPDGFLVWSAPVDEFTIGFRKFRRSTRAALHLGLLAFVLGCFSFFVWRLMSLEVLADVFESIFWTSGRIEVTWFWIGILSLCFLIFRLFEFSRESERLPNWGKPAGKESTAVVPNVRFDIAPYMAPDAMSVIEDAYRVSKTMGKTEMTPNVLFASALASRTGALFLVRLGLSFDRVKNPIASVLSKDQSGQPPIHMSKDARRTLALAYASAREAHRAHVGVIEIFLQAFEDSPRMQEAMDSLGIPPEHARRVAEWIRIEEQLHDDNRRFIELAALKPSSSMNRAMTARQTPLLDRFSEDLTLAARNGYLAPLVGRKREMDELLRAIEGGGKSVILVGEPGVGKESIVEGLARLMVEEQVPNVLFDKRLVSIDLAHVAASGDPGYAAERLIAMMNEVAISGNIVLVIRNAEALTGSAGPMDLSQILASELEKRYVFAILTITPSAWTEYLERRPIATKLTKIVINELPQEEVLNVLMAKAGAIEYKNRVFCSYAALEKASQLAGRYLRDMALPESALDILREASVLARNTKGERASVTAEDVAVVVRDRTSIPVEAVTGSERDKLLNLEEKLHSRVIGQDQAVVSVSRAIRRARAELREGKRPIANFLFLGPTGVGKTELAKALASEYFGSENAMIRLDMSEYQDSSSIARVIGAPGDQRGGLLTEAVRKSPFSIVLLDELEKAHPDILTLFLQVMDDGRLTDGVGRTVDFTNVMLIATSNAGTPFIQAETAKGTEIERITTALLEQELKGIFRPEFLNRFDGVVVFKPLSIDEVTQIAWLMINGISKRLEEKGIAFQTNDEAVEELAKAGYDPLFGARPLRRLIQERVDDGLADVLLRGEVGRRDTIILHPGSKLEVVKAKPV